MPSLGGRDRIAAGGWSTLAVRVSIWPKTGAVLAPPTRDRRRDGGRESDFERFEMRPAAVLRGARLGARRARRKSCLRVKERVVMNVSSR